MILMFTAGRYVNVEMRKFIIIISLVILYSLTGYAFFEKDIRVLTMQNGLADNTVSCIHKDRDGFMWFGTDNGLSRYDGKNIKNFGSDSLYMKVFHISETDNGLLWLIANGQLVCFDRRMEHFIPVRVSEKYTGVQDILSTFYLGHMPERRHYVFNQSNDLHFRQM